MVDAIGEGANAIAAILNVRHEAQFRQIIKLLGTVHPIASFVLAIVSDENQPLLDKLDEISNRLGTISQLIQDVKIEVQAQGTINQYSEAENIIQTGIDYFKKIVIHGKKYEERLKDMCKNEKFSLALNVLFKGITGEANFNNNILNFFYNKSNGDKQVIQNIFQLLMAGMVVLWKYESLDKGETEAYAYLNEQYNEKMKSASDAVDKILTKCETEFRSNMEKDIQSYLKKYYSTSNKTMASELNEQLVKKYGWLSISTAVWTKPTSKREMGKLDFQSHVGSVFADHKEKMAIALPSPRAKTSERYHDLQEKIQDIAHRNECKILSEFEFNGTVYDDPCAIISTLQTFFDGTEAIGVWNVRRGGRSVLDFGMDLCLVKGTSDNHVIYSLPWSQVLVVFKESMNVSDYKAKSVTPSNCIIS